MSAMWPEIAYTARFDSQNTVTVGWSFLEFIQSYSAGLQQFHNIDRWIWLELFSDDYDLGYPVPTLKRYLQLIYLFDLIIVMIRHGWFCRPCFFGKSQRIQSSFHWHKSSWSQLYHERNSGPVRQGFLLNELNYPLHLCSWSNISFVT